MTFTLYLFKLNDVVYFISISIYLGCWLYRSFIDRVHPPTPFIQFLFMCFSFEFPPPLYCILLGMSISILWLNLRIFGVCSFFGCLRIFDVLGHIWRLRKIWSNFSLGDCCWNAVYSGLYVIWTVWHCWKQVGMCRNRLHIPPVPTGVSAVKNRGWTGVSAVF